MTEPHDEFARAAEGLQRAHAQFIASVASWKRQIAGPLLNRLTSEWQLEEKVLADLEWPQMRIFWASNLGLIERRRSLRIWGAWMIRLSKKGIRDAEA